MFTFREKKDVGSEEAHSRLLEAWQAPEPLERPTISLFVDFALSFLAHADAALLQCLLPVRWVLALYPLCKGLRNKHVVRHDILSPCTIRSLCCMWRHSCCFLHCCRHVSPAWCAQDILVRAAESAGRFPSPQCEAHLRHDSGHSPFAGFRCP